MSKNEISKKIDRPLGGRLGSRCEPGAQEPQISIFFGSF